MIVVLLPTAEAKIKETSQFRNMSSVNVKQGRQMI
jgi:hypothetical protein